MSFFCNAKSAVSVARLYKRSKGPTRNHEPNRVLYINGKSASHVLRNKKNSIWYQRNAMSRIHKSQLAKHWGFLLRPILMIRKMHWPMPRSSNMLIRSMGNRVILVGERSYNLNHRKLESPHRTFLFSHLATDVMHGCLPD